MSEASLTDIRIPENLLPADGRFGCGPSKVPPAAIEALAAAGTSVMGTSHRQPTVKALVGRLRAGVASLFSLPEGYEVVLGNGGTTAFWDVASFGLIRERSQHLSFGEFSAKFAQVAAAAPHLAAPSVLSAPAGTRPAGPVAEDGVDLYALTHNETSTGVMAPVVRPGVADPDALVAVDATSGAGGLRFDAAQVDAYYFAPQKCFASDGGLWVAALSPAAISRAFALLRDPGARWVPASLDLSIAIEQSRLDQTYNTPAVATLLLFVHQLEWMLDHGGLAFAASRCDQSATALYDWAEKSAFTTPFVAEPDERSHVVGTIDFDDSIDAMRLAAVLRANGIVDTEPYRKLGRNQLRIGMFPAIEPSDVEALTACIDHVVERL